MASADVLQRFLQVYCRDGESCGIERVKCQE